MIRPLLISTPLLLAGCARDDGPYPSLMPRAVEARGFEEPAPAPPPAVAADPRLDVELAAAGARLGKAEADFNQAAAEARVLAGRARGAAAGSEPWISAQTALAALDALRAETSEVLGDLERLAIDRATALLSAYPALEEARARADAAVDAQAAEIARLAGNLAPA